MGAMVTFIAQTANAAIGTYLCDCGTAFEAFKSNVRSGHTRSCGCLRRRANAERFTSHGHKAGGKRSRAYVAWMNMKARCQNPSRREFPDYGGRGITVCERWADSFENFLADMGEPPDKLSLDRIDNELGYSLTNCRWVSSVVQNGNKRNVTRYTFDGRALNVAEWARKTGIGRVTLLKRLQRGVPLELALTHKGFLKMPKA